MNRALLKKALQEVRLLTFGGAAWLIMFCWVRVWIVSRLERSRFQNILEQLGDIVNILSPVSLSHLLTFTGRIAIGFDEPLVALIVVAFAIARGSDVVSGELNRGTLEMLLAQPVSRLQVLFTQAFITTIAIGVLASATYVGCWAGVQTTHAKVERQTVIAIPGIINLPNPFVKPKIEFVPMREEVDPTAFAGASVNLFCLGFCFAGLTSLISAAGRYQRRTVGIAITFLVLQMVCKLIGMAVKDFAFFKYFSLFGAYEPQRIVEITAVRPLDAWTFAYRGSHDVLFLGPLGYDAILLVIGLLGYLAAAVVFVRRDLPAPL